MKDSKISEKTLCQVIKSQCDIGSAQGGVCTAIGRSSAAISEDKISSVTGRVFVAKKPEVFTYDADGNMTGDGCFTYTWNDENRMVSASNAEVVVTYAYDHKGRMIRKTVSRPGADPVLISYLWDGWNIIREAVATNSLFPIHSSLFTYNLWGLDLDGTLQGSGGVGGLLAVVRDGETCLPTYDANGNISEYLSASDGMGAAHYDYSPFGEQLVASGPVAASFTHRFSTKPYCQTTGFYEYQMRKYNPNLGRWMSRDPIGEDLPVLFQEQTIKSQIVQEEHNTQKNSATTYMFTHNCSISLIDFWGLYDVPSCKIEIFLGHNTKSSKQRKGWVPKTINTGTLGAASAHACYSDKISIAPNRVVNGSSGEIPILDATIEANNAFEEAKTTWVKKLCKARREDGNCCEKITIKIVCKFGLDLIGEASVPGGACGKTHTEECK